MPQITSELNPKALLKLAKLARYLRPSSTELPSGQRLLFPLRDILPKTRERVWSWEWCKGTIKPLDRTHIGKEIAAAILSDEPALQRLIKEGPVPHDAPPFKKAIPVVHGHTSDPEVYFRPVPEKLDPSHSKSELEAVYTTPNSKLARKFGDSVILGYVENGRRANLHKPVSSGMMRKLAADAGMSYENYLRATHERMRHDVTVLDEVVEVREGRSGMLGRGKYRSQGKGGKPSLGDQLRYHYDILKSSNPHLPPPSRKYGDPQESTNVLRRLNFNRSQDVDWYYHKHPQWHPKELTGDYGWPYAWRIPLKAQEQHILEEGAFKSPTKDLPVGANIDRRLGASDVKLNLLRKALKGKADQKTVADIPLQDLLKWKGKKAEQTTRNLFLEAMDAFSKPIGAAQDMDFDNPADHDFFLEPDGDVPF